MSTTQINRWPLRAQALEYLARADSIPHRTEGEAELLDWLPRDTTRVLDVGSGDGRLLHLVKSARPNATCVALDFSDTMLERLRTRFATDASVEVVAHDLNQSLPWSLGLFDAIVSSFAIHHLPHRRKRSLYQEAYDLLRPMGVFCNLEHVASSSRHLHELFLACLDTDPEDEDPSNRLLDVNTQLSWLGDVGFADVDCHWKWRELALLAGRKPTTDVRAGA